MLLTELTSVLLAQQRELIFTYHLRSNIIKLAKFHAVDRRKAELGRINMQTAAQCFIVEIAAQTAVEITAAEKLTLYHHGLCTVAVINILNECRLSVRHISHSLNKVQECVRSRVTAQEYYASVFFQSHLHR